MAYIFINHIIKIISTFALGLTQYLKDDSIYFWSALIARLVQGVGNAMVQTATYAIVSHVFSEAREKYLGYAEAVTSVGLMLGPVIGGPLYNLCGYFWSFAIFAGFLIVSLAVSILITPSSLNRKIEQSPLT
jgi:MFS family permease